MALKSRLLRQAFILIVLLICSALAVLVYQMREITAPEYRQLREAFKAGSPAVQARIAAVMADGQVSRGEYSGAARLAQLTDVTLDNGATNVAEEKVVLAAFASQVKQ
jgi:hypothetical protein